MTLIRIGGVPEHFNWPWHLTLGEGAARAAGVDAEWQEFPDGSGAMAQALREQRLDAAMLLTEGAVAGIAAGGGFKIVSVYTESPLIWGIHVPASSRLRAVADLTGARYAISRRGSGSHLMAFVHARERGWPLDRLELVVVRDLKGAIDAFAQGSADVFFWEKFMTKPLVDDGRFRRVADFAAPWPAFVVCAADAALARHGAALRALLAAVLARAATFAASADAAAQIAARYGLQPRDAAEWLAGTRWSTRVGVEPRAIAPVIDALRAAGLVDAAFTADRAIAPLP
ncbi:MAG TPA: ABC transporter substrate-binding protein [Gammaproteobacteria bacterium]|nr:ABC transporter substrate-binding protein [Gammaproteobacteria bacterium]